MHYYQHHIGDFIRDTSRLSDEQCMAYMRLIWLYYESEQPLPNSPRSLAFRIGSSEEVVSLILEAFFKLEGDTWMHTRCESEIAEYKSICDRNRSNGKSGGRPKKTQPVSSGFPETQSKPSGFPEKTQSVSSGLPHGTHAEPGRNPNHKPVTNNQEPIEDQKHLVTGVTDFESFWKFYPRKVSKSEALKAWNKINPDQQLITSICAGLAKYLGSADWAKDDGQFIPHASTWLNQARWNDSPKPASNVVKLNRHGGFDQADYSDGLQVREDGTHAF